MVSLIFQIDVMSLDVAESGAIWGGVWWTIGGDDFPEVKWNDLAVAVSTETLVAVRDVNGGADRRRVRFFDGPFWIEFVRDKGGSFLFATSAGSTVDCDAPMFAELVRQVRGACGELLDECRYRGRTEDHDVRRLAALLAGET